MAFACTAASAQITVSEDGNSRIFNLGSDTPNPRINGNDFEDWLLAEGYEAVIRNANISVDGAGTLTFEVIGSQTNRLNAFFVNGVSAVSTTGNTNFLGDDNAGDQLSASVSFSEATSLVNSFFSFSFTKNNGRRRRFNINHNRFGIFVPNSGSLTGLRSVIFAFDDNTSGRDYDDLLIRANFEQSIPVPAPHSFWLLAAGLAFIWRRQRQKTKFVS